MDASEKRARPWSDVTLPAPQPIAREGDTRIASDPVPFLSTVQGTSSVRRATFSGLRNVNLGLPPFDPHSKGPPLPDNIQYLRVHRNRWLSPGELRRATEFDQNYQRYVDKRWKEQVKANAMNFWRSSDRFRASEDLFIRAQRRFAALVAELFSRGYEGLIFELPPVAGPLLFGSSRRRLAEIIGLDAERRRHIS